MQNFKLRVGSEFKWDQNPPTWTSVFLGSNDEVPNLQELKNQLEAYDKDEIELISIIGGLRFFDLISDVDFKRVTLFDRNINEFTKLVRILKELEKSGYEDFNNFERLDREIKNKPEQFYFPADLSENMEFQPKPDFTFQYDGKETPLHTLLSPDEYPLYSWNPSKKEYRGVKNTLLGDLNEELFLGLPEIDADGRLVFVYLSGVHHLDWGFTNNIKNTSHVIPIGSTSFKPHRENSSQDSSSKYVKGLKHIARGEYDPVIQYVWENKPPVQKGLKYLLSGQIEPIYSHMFGGADKSIGELNDNIINPHPYWEDMVLRYANSPILHIWSPEDSGLVGGKYDDPFDSGVEIQNFVKEGPTTEFESCIFHIIFGKNKAESFSDRKHVFTDALKKVKESRFDRVVITEHNKSSGQFEGKKTVLNMEQLENITMKVLDSDYKISVRRDIPGLGRPDRNMMLVIDKKNGL